MTEGLSVQFVSGVLAGTVHPIGSAATLGRGAGLPGSVLAVPCGEPEIVGVLEVSGKADGAGFAFGDIGVLSGLAHVASALLAAHDDVVIEVTGPEQISAEIVVLARRNPARYHQRACTWAWPWREGGGVSRRAAVGGREQL
jgi:hypothetical protein